MISDNEQTSSSLRLLSAIDVAAWQIPSLLSKSQGFTAKLPALQRSAVWKPRQVELLWDSLLNGFPVGSFLLTPFQRDRKTQNFLHETPGYEPQQEPDYHLLDGQQRCNAISLGFLNSWDPVGKYSASLWVDLETHGVSDERAFIFRVLTRSHPWGYQRSDPSKTLEHQKRRKALQAYSQAYKLSNHDHNAETLYGSSSLIRYAWPWDAICPVPVPFLLESVMNSTEDVWAGLGRLMEDRLPFWQALDTDGALREISWKSRFCALLEKPTPVMNRLIGAIRRIVGTDNASSFLIPALILPHVITEDPAHHLSDALSGGNPADTSGQDPVETLFIRINSAGTPLQGEELNYSILKSIWPGAQDVVEALSTGIMAPSRLVALVSRLAVARCLYLDKRPPAVLDVSRFRRLVHGRDAQCPDFLKSVQEYLSSGKEIFDLARNLLTMGVADDHKYRLPPVLVADIARNSPEVFFIYLLWLDRLKDAKIDPLSFDQLIQRRLIGSLTALSWFSEEDAICGTILWNRLQNHTEDNLHEFFSLGALKNCAEINENGKLPLIPLLPPDLLKESVEKSLYGLGNGLNQTWQTWNWWDNFTGSLPKSESARKWYSRKVKEDDDEVQYRREAWTKFADILWGKKEIVIYAQRDWLVKWFPSFDPSSPDQLEDSDRPWDFDHIHPQKYVYSRWNIPKVLKEWHGSIGNFRAWPFELNRSDGETEPRHKLKNAGEEGKRFCLGSNCKENVVNKELLKASCISQKNWPFWEASTPYDEWFPVNYLAKPDQYGECRVSLLNAITQRWIALYREWYDELLIKDLFR